MASYTVSQNGKSILEFEGLTYILGSTRKDGSEVWKCSERACEGRLVKRIMNREAVYIIIKEHTRDLPSFVQMVMHVALRKLRERALSDPTVAPAQVLQQTMKDVRDSIDAYVPSPSMMMNLVAKWRNEEQGSSTIDENLQVRRVNVAGGSSLRRQESTKKPSVILRKRTKMDASPKKSVDQSLSTLSLRDQNSSIYDIDNFDSD